MDIVKLKGIAGAIFLIMFLTGGVVFVYNEAGSDTIKLIKGYDYISYDWKQIPLLLFLPVMVLFDLFIVCMLLLPWRKRIALVMQKLMIPITVYSISSFVIGVVLSMVISVYPLGTDYYKCDSTSIVSSGSHYAKSKEICRERAYSSSVDSEVETPK
ncbi:MAG TPA: hypothetical protein VJY31_02680 [Buttiauxella sp.]|nr:hypothetical protein [Buttiauxella sp.]